MVLSIESKRFSHFTANCSFRLHNRIGGFIKYLPCVNEDGTLTYITSFEKYKTFGILSLKFRWIDKKYELYLEGDNITNVNYYDIGNVRQPGLCLMTGMKWIL